jgi:hypothetical protein
MFADEIVAVSWWLLTNEVVTEVPSQTTTELLLKLSPFTVREKLPPPAVALFGESEDTPGDDGHEEQEMAGSKKISGTAKSANIFIAAIIAAIITAVGVHRNFANLIRQPIRINSIRV